MNNKQTKKQVLFDSITVLDLTKVFSGPFATRHFADYGAKVIKIENLKAGGDDSRNFPPRKNNWSGYYEILNRNKQSITLDLKNKDDLQIFYELAKKADIIVENYSPSVKKRLLIDYPEIKKINPQIIYASLSGTYADSDRRYYDIIAQAESGFVSLCGNADQPVKAGPAIMDSFSGLKLAFAISSALYYRQVHNKGQQIFVSMLGAGLDLLEQNLIQASVENKNPKRLGNIDNAIAPFGLYEAKDGLIALAVGNDKLWVLLKQFLEQHANFDNNKFTTTDLRLQNNVELKELIEEVFLRFNKKELGELLGEIGIPCGVVNEMMDIVNNKEYKNKNLIYNIQNSNNDSCVLPTGGITFSEQPEINKQPAPVLGENNKEYGI